MDKILELCDSCSDKYPQHFQIFLDNCIKNYSEAFGPNDYLFAAVYFMILETGFSPVCVTGNAEGHESVSFDIRKLQSVTAYTEDQIKLSGSSNNERCCIYQISLKLGKHSSNVCELQGVPSAELNSHLIVNFLSKEPQTIKSVCLKTDMFTEKNEIPSEHKYLLKNLRGLSLKIKNKVAIQIKDLILTNEEEGCSANLLCLPEEIQKKIIQYLAHSPCGIQALASSCSYFRTFINKDTKLWEEMCFREFSGWVLNKALQELCITGDVNVFRTAFIFLKRQECTSKLKRIQDHGIGQSWLPFLWKLSLNFQIVPFWGSETTLRILTDLSRATKGGLEV